jgi:hypothetical protein
MATIKCEIRNGDYLVLMQRCIHDPRRLIRELVDVAAKEDGVTGFDHGDDSGFEVRDLSVDI